MNTLDLLIIGLTIVAGLGGYRLGLLARAASWIGLSIGLLVAIRLLPSIVEGLNGRDPSGKLALSLLVLVGAAFIGQGVGLVVGMRIHRFLPHGPLRVVDRGMGGVVGAFGVLLSVWLILPAMADVPGWPSVQARSSAIARAIDDHAPPPPNTLDALRRLVGDTGFPQVFRDLQRAPDAGVPPASLALSVETQARVRASTVKVEGQACRRIQEGSGFTPRPDLVVTNAHVVAGVRQPRVIRPDGRRLAATPVIYDPDRDLAVLRVSRLGEPPLSVGEGRQGDEGAVFGHPEGQDPVRAAPAAIRQRVEAVGNDLYDTHLVRRDVFVLASSLRPGDSGGPLVNVAGAVVGVAFAIAPDRPDTAYAVTSKELNAVLARPTAGAVSTGPCLTD